MRNRLFFLTLLVALPLALLPGQHAQASEQDVPPVSFRAFLSRDGGHPLFLRLLQAAGRESLLDRGDVTVLVPSEEYLASLGKEEFEALLKDPEALRVTLSQHVAPGTHSLAKMVADQGLTVESGLLLSVDETEDGVLCAGWPLTVTDVRCGSVTVHQIEGLLESLVEEDANEPEFLEEDEMEGQEIVPGDHR